MLTDERFCETSSNENSSERNNFEARFQADTVRTSTLGGRSLHMRTDLQEQGSRNRRVFCIAEKLVLPSSTDSLPFPS